MIRREDQAVLKAACHRVVFPRAGRLARFQAVRLCLLKAVCLLLLHRLQGRHL
jgi:hypothetical protein